MRRLLDLPDKAVRIAYDPVEETLYVFTAPGDLYRLEVESDEASLELLYNQEEHGTPVPEQPSVGMDVGPDGTIYLVGNEDVGEGGGWWEPADSTRAVIRRGVPVGDGTHTWSTVATTEPYLLSHTWFDHRYSAVEVSPDGETLYINAGSRTDHGEMYDGVREEGLTAVILQVPTDGENLTLPNDREALREQGYVYAEGTRNVFDLTHAPNGDLFGVENAGDRDDSEEMNWLREGHHYGFPWRIGTNDTPMQYEGYDPDEDACVMKGRNPNNQADTGWYFSDDPTFPPQPELVFSDPIANTGPDADHFRDCETGEVIDASEQDTSIGSFTSHRSPMGLVFDQDSVLAGPFNGGGFVLSWNHTQEEMLRRLDGVGEDILHVDLEKQGDAYSMTATRIVKDFHQPIDAEMLGNKIYVVEYGPQYGEQERTLGIFEVTLPEGTGSAVDEVAENVLLRASSYPNPFRGRMTLSYDLPQPSHVRAVVYDVLGREVATLVDDRQAAGSQTLTFDGAELPGGIYFCRLTAGDESRTLTLTKVR